MDSSDDSLLVESTDSQSDQESEESFESSSHQKQNKKILILSAESLSSAEGKKCLWLVDFDLGSLGVLSEPDSNISPSNGRKRNPVVIKAQPIASSPRQYNFLPESDHLSTNEEQNCLKMESDEQNSEKRVRERNVTPSEKNTLLKIWKRYPVLNIKVCNNEVNQRKRKAWENIQKEFVSLCPDPESNSRSIKFLQGCWKRFKKEMSKSRRETDEEEEEESCENIPSDQSTTRSKTGSTDNLKLEDASDSAINEYITRVCQPPTKEISPFDVSSNTTLLSGFNTVMNKSEKVISNGKPPSSNSHTGDSNADICNGGSIVSCKETLSSKQNVLNSTSMFPMQRNVGLNSEFEPRTMSIRSLRRRALQLAVEAEKEKLAAFRYQKEAEQERLAAIKLQRSAQKYALLVEKEKYETELLKKEAARRSLEKFS